MAMSVLSVFIGLVSLFFVSWEHWFVVVVPAASVVPVSTAVLRQLPVFRKANEMWETVKREYPSVATFCRNEVPQEATPGMCRP